MKIHIRHSFGFSYDVVILILIIAIVTVFTACSDTKKEVELHKKISDLETQLDKCQNGANKLYAKIKIAYEKKDLEDVKNLHAEIKSQHPESSEFKESKKIYDEVIRIEEKKRKEEEDKLAKEKQEQLKSLNKLKKRHDDVSGTTWYKQPYFTHYNNSNLTSIYMGEEGSSRWLRLKMSYNGENWIFFENAYLSYDGNTKEIIFDRYKEKKTENDGGEVWEWIDLTVTKDVEMFLREFAKSKNAKMRLSGKYSKTRTLTDGERQGILDVLNGYDVLERGIK